MAEVRAFRVALMVALLLAVSAAGRAGAGDLRHKLSGLMLTQLDAQDLTIAEIVEFLQRECKRLDPEHAGINFFFKGTPALVRSVKERRITLSLSNVPMSEALHYICMAAALNYAVEESAVVIADRCIPLDQMETRFYRVQPGVLNATRTRRARRLDRDPDEDD